MLRALGGGCQLPIAGHAIVYYQELRLEGLIAARDGKQVVRDHLSGPTNEAERIGAQLAARLLERGADRLLR